MIARGRDVNPRVDKEEEQRRQGGDYVGRRGGGGKDLDDGAEACELREVRLHSVPALLGSLQLAIQVGDFALLGVDLRVEQHDLCVGGGRDGEAGEIRARLGREDMS